jgi:CDP-glucose 4,6-dehydratase
VWGYRETDVLNGYDPYSNSKSCSELVTDSYQKSFFSKSGVSIVAARAGNVIGGGDYSEDRIIPDCVRSAAANTPIIVRNPASIRPYQHVLEPVCAYLMLAANMAKGAYNVGPDEGDCVTTSALVDVFCKNWGDGASWKNVSDKNAPHEAGFLRLDSSKIKREFGWLPKWNIQQAVEKTVEWYKSGDPVQCMERQIGEYLR